MQAGNTRVKIASFFITILLAAKTFIDLSSFANFSDESYESKSTNSSSSTGLTMPHIPSYLSYCENNNFIPTHSDLAVVKTVNNTRRFSIRKSDFQPTHSAPCGTSDELLQAISMGQRRWDDEVENSNLTLLQKEGYPSTFIPYQCYIPYYKPEQICDVLNRFSHVIIQGDSLSRHLQGGLLMALREDLKQGSIVSSDPTMYKCQCDAQFSENINCRKNDGLYNRFRPSQLGLCTNLGNGTQEFESVYSANRLHTGVYKFPGVNCTSPESKGVLVIVQGGIHMRYKPVQTFNRLIRRFFYDPTFRTCAEQGKAIFIWTSYTAQSPEYDEKYAHQTVKNGLRFNAGIKNKFQKSNISAPTVDWLSFTTGAQHTDGIHYAAQVNLFKAQHLIALVDRLWTEKRFFMLPN